MVKMESKVVDNRTRIFMMVMIIYDLIRFE